MFCYQCEQAAKGIGCKTHGVCGKDARTAALQDLLVHATEGLSMYARRAAELAVRDREVDVFALEALFATLTNVNFDPERLGAMLQRAAELKQRMREAYERAGGGREALGGPAAWQPAGDLEGLVRQGKEVSIAGRRARLPAEVVDLQELVLYGLKGMAAYADHAQILGFEDQEVYAFFHQALDYLASTPTDPEDLVSWALRVGEVNLRVMGLLDAAHTANYGDPEPTWVRIEPVKGKAICVSGHDMRDLAELLEQTRGKGVNVYTHGEMLPAHGYPELRKHEHLVGNYGGAWQLQREEFDAFPGAILMTTNCLQAPRDSYRDRIFTAGVVGWPGVRHIEDRCFGPVIEAALGQEGFAEDGPDRRILVGCGHAAVMSRAEEIVAAVRAGQVRRFFVIGGCDGAKPGRSYYTELAQAAPEDTVILTLACGKYRFNKLEFGEVAGIPRLLDVGQCNDAYSAIRIAQGLAEALGVEINALPLSIVLSWFEQKAVAILLTLLHLGMRNMRIGPTLPAFVPPSVLRALQDKLGLRPIGAPEADLREMLGGA